MPTLNITTPARIVDGSIKQYYSFYNEETGRIEKRTLLVEDDEVRSVSNSVTDSIDSQIRQTVNQSIDQTINQIIVNNIEATIEFVTESLSVGQTLNISTSFAFSASSISVYLNGLNITDDCTFGESLITLNEDYSEVIEADSKLLVSYLKK